MRFLKNGATALLLLLLYMISGQARAIAEASGGGAAVTAMTAMATWSEDEAALCGNVEIGSRFYELLGGKKAESEALYLCPSGDIFGIRLREEGVGVSEAMSGSPLRAGDRILAIDGARVHEPEEVERLVRSGGGGIVKLTVARGAEELTLSVAPRLTDGGYKLGAVLRSAASGIGTITFVDPTSGFFGGLGHGVTTGDGQLVAMKSGATADVVLGGIKRGEAGKPGELSGMLGKSATGYIYANTECGIFGGFDAAEKYAAEALPVGTRAELHEGEAEIISSVRSGKKARYKIEICDIDRDSTGSKSFKIRVTDPTLIAITGGIVRGMSGSPIIQDGKLVGAVTHVMVADPTEGYGIFIENMLNASRRGAQPKAA